MTEERTSLPRAAWPDGAERRALMRRVGVVAAGVTTATVLLRNPEQAEPQVVAVDPAGGSEYRRLQDAVERAPAGSIVMVRPGLHEVAGELDPADGVAIIGDGWGSHVRLRDGGNASVFRITHNGVILERLRIDGNGRNQLAASSNCVLFDGVDSGAVRGCLVEEAAGYNIVAFPGCSGITIAGNRSEHAIKEGIELQGASNCLVEGNLVRDCRINGLLLWNSSGDCGFNSVRGNVVSGSGGYGLLIQDGAHDSSVVGNVFRRSARGGIVIDAGAADGPGDAPGNVVLGNVVAGSGGDGIFLNYVSTATIQGNVVSASRLSGVRALRARFCTMTGNVIERSGRPGLDLDGDGLVVTGNVCTHDGGLRGAAQERAAVTVRDGARAVVSGNALEGSPGPALWLGEGAQTTVGANLIGTGRVVGPAARAPRAPVRRISARVGPRPRRVEHGLGYVPATVSALTHANADIWIVGSPTASHVTLQASRAADADILVG